MDTGGTWAKWYWARKEADLLLIAGTTMAVDTTSRHLLAMAGWQFQTTGLIVAIGAAAFSSSVRRGLAVGFVFSGIVSGNLIGGAIRALGVFTALLVWGSLWLPFHPRNEWRAWIIQYLTVTLVSIVALVSTVAWLADALGRMAFWTALQTTIVGNLPLALAGLVIAWPLATWTHDQERRPHVGACSPRGRALVAGIVMVWAVAGYLGSLFSMATDRAPTRVFGRRLPSVTETVLRTIGPRGKWLLLIVGFVMLAVLVSVIHRFPSSDFKQ